MSIDIGPPEVDELRPRITVIGVGGAGGNAVANMIASSVEGVDFIVANTDAQALKASPAEYRIQLGVKATQGLGAGSRPEVGRTAAEESIGMLESALEGTHMCFLAAGMGGGTGTGATPVIAKAARDRGILTVGVITKPFSFEGQRRMRLAEAGVAELQENVDTLIVIPNQNLFLVANPNTTFKEAFTMADEVLQRGVRGITDLMVMPGLINLDFADVRSVMREMGKAMMGTGEAEGDGRAIEAAQKAIANPLLDGISLAGAKGVIISITGSEDMRLMEVDEAASHIREMVDPDANIIWGSTFNDSMQDRIRVSVVATGIDGIEQSNRDTPPSRSLSFPLKKIMPECDREGETRSASEAGIASTSTTESASTSPTDRGVSSLSPLQSQDEAPLESHRTPTSQDVVPQSGTSRKNNFVPMTPFTNMGTAGLYTDDDELILDKPETPRETKFGEEEHIATRIAHKISKEVLSKNQSPPAREANPLRSWSAEQEQEQENAKEKETTPIVKETTGRTLFERMSRLSRGEGVSYSNDEDDDKKNNTDIPRFLNRQDNN